MFYLLVILSITTISSNVKEKSVPVPPNIREFLEKIEQIESSGGQDTNHPIVTKDNLQQGTRAIGRYGLMPNTVKELVNRRRVRGTVSPDMIDVANLPPEEMKAKIEANPEMEDQFANDLANHVIQRQGGDEDKAAYSWQMGHNLTPDEITPDALENNNYVNKFRRLAPMINKNSDDNQ